MSSDSHTQILNDYKQVSQNDLTPQVYKKKNEVIAQPKNKNFENYNREKYSLTDDKGNYIGLCEDQQKSSEKIDSQNVELNDGAQMEVMINKERLNNGLIINQRNGYQIQIGKKFQAEIGEHILTDLQKNQIKKRINKQRIWDKDKNKPLIEKLKKDLTRKIGRLVYNEEEVLILYQRAQYDLNLTNELIDRDYGFLQKYYQQRLLNIKKQ